MTVVFYAPWNDPPCCRVGILDTTGWTLASTTFDSLMDAKAAAYSAARSNSLPVVIRVKGWKE